MSVLIDGNNERVNLRSPAGVELDPATHMMWFQPTDISTTLQYVLTKIGASSGWTVELNYASTAGRMRVTEIYNTTNTEYITSDDPFTEDEWQFLAVMIDQVTTPKVAIYRGTKTTAAVESTYGTSTDGTSTPAANSSPDLFIGNSQQSPLEEFHGDFDSYIYVNRRLTLGEIIHWQYTRGPVRDMTRYYPGFGFHGVGANSQKDYSGNAEDEGTAGPVSVSDPAPLGPIFGADDASAYVVTAAGGGLSIPVAMANYRRSHQSVA